MTRFTSYTLDTVPDRSREALEGVVRKYGELVNVYADMAESPLPIEIYGMAQDMVMKRATLGPVKANLAQLAISVEHACQFCVPAHSWAASAVIKTDPEIVAAVRDGRDGPDAEVNAMVRFVRLLVRHRGHVPEAEIDAFLAAGGTCEQVFELLCIVAFKTITNYTSALAGTKPNERMMPFAWEGEAVPT